MISLAMLIDKVIDIYTWIVIASAIMSWLVAFGVVNVRNQFIRVIVDLLFRVTEPVLRPIRRLLPNLGGVDISPVILLLGLFFLRSLLWEYVWPSFVRCSIPLPDPAFPRRPPDGLALQLRAQPGARRTALELTPEGGLKAAVTSPPEDGKANAAVIALLAETWRLPKSAFDVVRGTAARDKTVKVVGDAASLAGRIAEWVSKHG